MPTESEEPKIDGVDMPSWILRFDKHGACTSPITRDGLLQRLREQPPSDVIAFAHGWNNDHDDALAMYSEFLRNLELLARTHPPGRRFDPFFVGITWPSIWLTFSDGPAIAATGDSSETQAQQQVESELVDLVAQSAAGPGAAAPVERIHALLARPELDVAEAHELARLVAPAFRMLGGEEIDSAERITDPDDLIFVLRALQKVSPRGLTTMLESLDDWGESPAEVAAESGPRSDGAPVQTAGVLQLLDPRTYLRLFSLYQMKDRAGAVGHAGVATLLRDLLEATAEAGTPAHGVGHSFGCKVMLSAVCAPEPMPRPLHSLLLLQPAVSHLCFASQVPGTQRPGGYVAALSPDRVRPPLYSTYSRKDMPLHDVFHLAVRRAGDLGEVQIAGDRGGTTAGAPPSRFAALGGYGPRWANQQLVDPMPAPGTAYPISGAGTPIVAFDGSRGSIDGHGDVCDANAAWALHQLVFRPTT